MASSLYARQSFAFLAEGTRRESAFNWCIRQNKITGKTEDALASFTLVMEPGQTGYVQRENFDAIDGVIPCPMLMMKEKNLGWNVARLSRFKHDDQTFQCEYAVRGETYLCELLSPTNYGP